MLLKFLKTVVVQTVRTSSKRCFSEAGFCPGNLHGKIGVLGVPFGKGQKKGGKDEAGLKVAPDFLRKTGFCELLSCIGVDVSDFGNVKYEAEDSLTGKNMHNLDHVAPLTKSVSSSVRKILKEERTCLVLGGDHTVAVGSIAAHLQVADPRKVAVVYVDAHADINTNKTSPSGNIHGMTLAMLSEEIQEHWEDSCVPGMDWLTPCLSLKNVAFIGTRSVDFGEANFLKKNKAAVFGIEDIDKYGVDTVLCKALRQIDPFHNKSIHVSFDIDALDCLEAPCTTAPVRGGLTLREGIAIAEYLNRTGRLGVVDLVEVNAVIGDDFQRQLTLEAAKNILLAMFGYCRQGNKKVKRR